MSDMDIVNFFNSIKEPVWLIPHDAISADYTPGLRYVILNIILT